MLNKHDALTKYRSFKN